MLMFGDIPSRARADVRLDCVSQRRRLARTRASQSNHPLSTLNRHLEHHFARVRIKAHVYHRCARELTQ